MPRVENREQLTALRDEILATSRDRRATRTRILIGMGTCGIAAGAREVMDAVRTELKRHALEADIVPVGCIGICQMEPLVDIEQPGLHRVTYKNIQPDQVPRLIEEHLRNKRVVPEWAVGRLHPDGIEPPNGNQPQKEAGA